MKFFEGQNVPIFSWCNDIEEQALIQAKNLTKLPFIYKHVCLMPDAHSGYGMPIGGVIACNNVVIPNAVGVDIGCGMCAVKTDKIDISTDDIKKVLVEIRKLVPMGFKHHDKPQKWDGFSAAPKIPIIQKELQSARHQLGTLGGGNHFIEIQKDNDGFIWIMAHSGSRNFGLKIAKEYNALAQKLCKRWYSNIPEQKGEDGLAFLPFGSMEANDYMFAMNYALKFAKANRSQILANVIEAFNSIIPNCSYTLPIDIHHNYARWENHFGKNVIVHRKGATSAKEGEIGVIPGSQGTASYIVKGKGNPKSFTSCSHGAGRKMSRTKAKNELCLEDEIAKLNKLKIVHSVRNTSDLDEASGAYKDIDIVMEEQNDLVEIVTKLTPLGVVKA